MATATSSIALADLYRDNFDFVWRTLGQFGVTAAGLEDAAHDVFLVVHRRLVDFDENKGSMRAWLYGIARKVADKYRRGQARAHVESAPEQSPPTAPDRQVELSQAASLVQEFLDGVDAERREVFVMTEVEGMSAPEIAAALNLKLNTVYSRLRRARNQFSEFVTERMGEVTGN
jgi:RNA polymerase sigma-70 factor (ECF subfamily)